jgi:predicted membrane-bound dolichyl-phosphate-mannose-protein mannosyltransferase
MLATFLFAFEDMTFVHSGLALLDVYMVTFTLLAVWAYLEENYILMGVFVALSANCKLFGALIIIALFIHWAIYKRNKWKELSISLVVAAVAFVFILVWADVFITHGLENPFTRINDLLSRTLGNVFMVPKLSISSRPWTWLYPQWVAIQNKYNYPAIPYSYDPQYISFISSTLQLFIIPAIGYMIYKMIKNNQAAGLVVLWFIATYVIWIPMDIVTNRITFVFYFLATTPAICIGISMAISDWLDYLKKRQRLTNGTTPLQTTGYLAVGLYMLLHLAIWVIFNPLMPVLFKPYLL